MKYVWINSRANNNVSKKLLLIIELYCVKNKIKAGAYLGFCQGRAYMLPNI